MPIEFQVTGEDGLLTILASKGNFSQQDTCNISFMYKDSQDIINNLEPALTNLLRRLSKKVKNVD